MVVNGEVPNYRIAKLVLHQKPWTPKEVKKQDEVKDEVKVEVKEERKPLLATPEEGNCQNCRH